MTHNPANEGLPELLARESEATIALMHKYLAVPFPRSGRRGTFTAPANASGETARSLRQDTATAAGRTISLITAVLHWQYADAGRGPGSPPPVGAIMAWVRRKGFVAPGEDPRRVAFAVARAIGERGTSRPPSRFAAKALADEDRRLARALERHADTVTVRFTDNLLAGRETDE